MPDDSFIHSSCASSLVFFPASYLQATTTLATVDTVDTATADTVAMEATVDTVAMEDTVDTVAMEDTVDMGAMAAADTADTTVTTNRGGRFDKKVSS